MGEWVVEGRAGELAYAAFVVVVEVEAAVEDVRDVERRGQDDGCSWERRGKDG